MMPAVLVVLIGGRQNSAHDIHHGLLAAAAGRFVALYGVLNVIVLTNYRALSLLITEALKNRVGKS